MTITIQDLLRIGQPTPANMSTPGMPIDTAPAPVATAMPGNWMDASGSDWSTGAVGLTGTNPSGWMDSFSNWLRGAVGTKETPGWGGLAIGGASALSNAFMGMKQYGLAKQTLAENKRQFQLNYDAQKQSLNTGLEDRQAARVASNPGAYQSVGDYMNLHGMK